jgi:hypothetical protein
LRGSCDACMQQKAKNSRNRSVKTVEKARGERKPTECRQTGEWSAKRSREVRAFRTPKRLRLQEPKSRFPPMLMDIVERGSGVAYSNGRRELGPVGIFRRRWGRVSVCRALQRVGVGHIQVEERETKLRPHPHRVG